MTQEPKLKRGDWIYWHDKPAIVIQVEGIAVEVSIWVELKDLDYVPKH